MSNLILLITIACLCWIIDTNIGDHDNEEELDR